MQATSPKHKRSNFLYQRITSEHSGDMERLVEILDKIEASQANFAFRCSVYSLSSGRYSPSNYSIKFVRDCINRGHRDISVFAYVNPMQERYESTRYGTRRSYKPISRKNWVLDLDKSKYESEKDILALYEKSDLPLPNLISSTADTSNYHIAVLGKEEQFVDLKARIAYCVKLFGIDTSMMQSTDEIVFAIKAHGVDYNYLCQDIGSHKIRLGGSINPNHITEDGKPFVVRTWINPEHNQSVVDIDIDSLMAVKGILKPDFNKYSWENLEKPLTLLLRPIVGRKYAKIYAKILCENMTFLRRGCLALSQKELAKRVKVSQRAVSKHLKKLVDAKILWTNHFWFFDPKGKNSKCKEYRIGAVLISKFFEDQLGVHKYDLTRPYDKDGETNTHLLNDVKQYAFLGVDDSGIKDICSFKMYPRPKGKKRDRASIQCVINWVRKKYTIPDITCKLDVADHIREISERC